MKIKKKLLLTLLALACCLLITTPVLAQSPTPQPENPPTYTGDKVVVGNTFRLQSGESLLGNLVVIGGTANIEAGATITGDVVLTGGTITLSGKLDGNLVAIGGAITLADGAVVNGDIVTVGASLKKSDSATVNGQITEQTPTMDLNDHPVWQFPWQSKQNLLASFLTATFEAFAMAAFAVVVGLILPRQTHNLSAAIQEEPLISGAVGLLAVIGSPILLVILVITLILIPVAVLYVILFGLALAFGWIGLGNFVGEKLSHAAKGNWAPAVSAGIGTLLISMLIGAINLIPCVGWIIGAILSLVGLGAIVITKFGSTSASAGKTPPPAAVPQTTSLPPVPPASQQSNGTDKE
jgi:hypothetical protein